MGGIAKGLAGENWLRAQLAGEQATGAIRDVQLPSVKKMSIKLQEMVQQGLLSPEQAQTFLQEASAYESIDPRAREAELGALGQLQGVIDERGLDPQARAALQQAKQEAGTYERGQREAILQNAAARGISGSGIELASMMGGQQGSATRLANQGFQQAAAADARKMAALQDIGQLSGQISSEDARKAEAQNAINQFNAANRQGVENANVQARNAAAAQNLAEKQRIADENIGLRNQQELYNKALNQQAFQNQLAQRQAYANASLGQASTDLGVAKERTQDIHNQTAKWSDERLKKDLEAIDPQEFLDGLTGYKYKFKSKKFGDGDQVGVMAQDIEKVAPQSVNETEEGKSIDFTKLGGPILAALAALNEKVDELEESYAS